MALIDYLLNFLSLAFGLTIGSLLSYMITRREISKTIQKFSESEFATDLKQLIKKANELLKSNEAKQFFITVSQTIQSLMELQKHHSEPLITIPNKFKNEKSDCS